MDVKRPGDFVYLLGKTYAELGASEYYASKGFIGNVCPRVNAEKAKKLYRALNRAIAKGLIQSCHDCSDGGLGVALAESSFAGGLGMEIDLRKVPRYKVFRNDQLLFSESQSRFVVTVSRAKSKKFEALMKGNVFSRVGVIRKDERFLVAGLQGKMVIDTSIVELKEAWQRTLKF
jgi:phosphoribosylformylglycinamidine synthase